MTKTITFDKNELDTILDAVEILQRRATELRGHALVADSTDLSLAIAAVQIRCRNIGDRINRSPQDAEGREYE